MTVENAQTRYKKKAVKVITLALNRNTDTDILNKLASVPNKQGYIKSLVRADIAKAKRKAAQQAKAEN